MACLEEVEVTSAGQGWSRSMLAEPMLELMLLMDAHPKSLRAYNAIGVLLAQLRVLHHCLVFPPPSHTSSAGEHSPPPAHVYNKAAETIAYHSDPLRLAMRAINSCLPFLDPLHAEPLSQRLPPRLQVAEELLEHFLGLYVKLLWWTSPEGKLWAADPALLEESRTFVTDFIRAMAPRLSHSDHKVLQHVDQQDAGIRHKCLGLSAYTSTAAVAWATVALVPGLLYHAGQPPVGKQDTEANKGEQQLRQQHVKLDPGISDALGLAQYAYRSAELCKAGMHHNIFAPTLEIIQQDLAKDIAGQRGKQETRAPSLKELLDVMESPFAHSLCAQTQKSRWAIELSVPPSGSSEGKSPCYIPPQRSKAQRMGLLLDAQSCMPTAMRLLVAAKQEKAVDPVQCCNVDCKGSKQPGVMWCPHCLGLVWCNECVSSPSCRVHCSKCSRRGI